MVAIRRVSSTVAALALFLIVPSVASAHTLAVSAGPSRCVSPLSGQYTATVTITETYFGGTVENIPVGQNVHELSTSTDRGNTGLNQNYFTQGAVGTQTGPANLGQPVSFTSPSSGAATQTFTVTTSVPETYVLGNSYMRSPSSTTITAPTGGCAPPPSPPAVSVTAQTSCASPLDGTFNATIDITSSAAFAVPAGTSAGSRGVNFLSPNGTGAPSSIRAGQTTFTLTGLTQSTVYVVGAPGGNIASVTIAAPSGGCTPPPPPTCNAGQTLVNGVCTTPSCASGQTLVNGTCVTPTCTGAACNPQPPTCAPSQTLAGGRCVSRPSVICPPGEVKSGNGCVREACRVAARSSFRVRAGEMNTIIVSVRTRSGALPGATVRITLPGGKTITVKPASGSVTVRVKPKHSGTIYVRSTGCVNAKLKVFAPKVPTAHHPPAFTG